MKTWIVLLTFSVLLGCGNSGTPTMQNNASSTGASAAPAKVPDERAALDAVSQVNQAQATYFKLNRRYALTYDELVEAHLLKAEPSAVQTGYEFKLRPAADAQTYKLTVSPAGAAPNVRSFFTDQTGAVRAETGKDATADSSKIE